MTTAQLAARLIRVFEGLRLKAYRDATGTWTVGYGHTLTAKEGMTITVEQAEELFAQDMAPLLKQVEGLPLIEAAALVSFGFNCGLGALKRVMAGESKLSDFTKSKGKELPGLVSRRQLEAALIEAAKS